MTDFGMVAPGPDVDDKGRVTHLAHLKSLFSVLNVTLEGPFTGTFMALSAPLTLATLTAPAVHTGAFYARDITVNPDNTITYFPFAGPPTPTSS